MFSRFKALTVAFAIATVSAVAVAAAQDNSTDPEIQRLNLQRLRAEAAKTESEAQKARIEAEIAAQMAPVNALPEAKAGEFKITPNTNAGLAEARILSTQQLNTVAGMIARDFQISNRVIILTSDQKPDLGRYRDYEARRAQVARMYAEIERRAPEVAGQVEEILGDTNEPSRATAEMSLATVTSGVALLARLGSLFQSSYDIGGGDVTTMNSAYLAQSVASVLADGNRTVFLGWDWMGETGYSTVVNNLSELDERRIRVSRLLSEIQREEARYTRGAERAPDGPVKVQYARVRDVYKDFAAEISEAMTAHEQFVSWLSTAADNKPAPYSDVVRQIALMTELQQSQVLIVQVHDATQGNIVRRNLWTFFGGPPFSVAASSSSTAQLIDPRNGATTRAAAYGCDSPYTRMNRIHERARDGRNVVNCRRLT